MSVCHAPSNCFFFVSWWNRAIFLAVSSPWPIYKTLFFDFWFRPPNAQNLHKIAYKSASMADRPEMFGPTRGFSGMADSMEPCRMLWGPTLVAMATKFGLGAEIQSPIGLLSLLCIVCTTHGEYGWIYNIYTVYWIYVLYWTLKPTILIVRPA